MNLNELATIWVIIKPSIEDGDPREAADLLVNHLINNSSGVYVASEIKKAFGRDEDIIEALAYFSDDDDYDQDEDVEDQDDDWD